MVNYALPQTLVRTGNLNGDLERTIRKLDSNFIKLPFISDLEETYFIYNPKDSYLIAVSKTNSTSDLEFVSVSYSEEKNQQIADLFEKATNIKLNGQNREKCVQHLYKLFNVFEENGEGAMDSLFYICKLGAELMKFLKG